MYLTLKENRNHGTKDYPYSQYHVFNQQTAFQFPIHWHDELEIIYIRNGSIYIAIDKDLFTGTGGSFFIVNPGELHYMGSNDLNADYYTILFPLEFISFQSNDYVENMLFKPMRSSHVILTHSLPYSEIYAEIISLLEKLIYINKYEKGFYQLDCKILLLEILSNILSIPDILVKKTSNASDMRREIITYVNDNYLEKITLSDLADEFHMSEKYISRYFKKHFNITFSKYVNHMRLLYAKNLLDTTNISITDVALSSGFPNVSYFIRSFKESYGKTPFSYRTDNISVDM